MGRCDGTEIIALLAWAKIRMPIVEVHSDMHVARLSANPLPSNVETDARYWIENAPDALDSPGEWRLDRASRTVFYWPMAGEDLARDPVIAPGAHSIGPSRRRAGSRRARA
jgi:hypothetical protein